MRVVARIGVAGEGRRPVGRNEPECVPAILPAAAKHRAALDQDVLAAGLLEPPAHRQAGLPGADDHGFRLARQLHGHSWAGYLWPGGHVG